ncbi:MAG TPA: hypothetical protein ENI80_01470 [Acidiferrobacteraceae bacterium]|nr:hypothetical protein [Acidiferrobacteraceae bacterium]
MSLRPCFSIFVFLVTCVAVAPARSDSHMEDPEYKFEFNPSLVKYWNEGETQIPAYPKDRNLMEVAGSPTDRGRLFVDSRSVTLGKDKVVRFAYVIESTSGARNVFFEGIRCDAQQYKTYAYGTPEGKWKPISDPKWQPLRYWGQSPYRYNLARDYLCAENEYARSPRDIVRRIKYDILDNEP